MLVECAQPNERLRINLAGTPFDLIDHAVLHRLLSSRSPEDSFEYVVTPNVDHVVRNHRNSLPAYSEAWLSVCDSRVLAMLARLVGIKFPEVITGSDLTDWLLRNAVSSGDVVVIVGCDEGSVLQLRSRFTAIEIHHINPPMGFIRDSALVGRVVDFVTQHPARFTFLAVGSPQQEILASAIKRQGAKGIGLCVGASLLFAAGAERRAPSWVQRLSMEWLFRLVNNPRRLWRRYLIGCPAILPIIGCLAIKRVFRVAEK